MFEQTVKYTEQEILRCIKSAMYRSNFMVLKNVFVYAEESDCLIISKSMYTHEIEVKISRSDFFADTKKYKHHKFNNILDGKNFYTLKYPAKMSCPLKYSVRTEKPMKMFVGDWASGFYHIMLDGSSIPNRFSYAVPEGLVDIDEIPGYAGLYYVDKWGGLKQVRQSKMFHKEKFSMWKALATKLYYNRQEY